MKVQNRCTTYLIRCSPVLDPPIIESHSAQWIVASISYINWAIQENMNEPDKTRSHAIKQIWTSKLNQIIKRINRQVANTIELSANNILGVNCCSRTF
jgi:hypothetical protein